MGRPPDDGGLFPCFSPVSPCEAGTMPQSREHDWTYYVLTDQSQQEPGKYATGKWKATRGLPVSPKE